MSKCPTPHELGLFLAEEADPSLRQWIIEHTEHCAGCQQNLEQLSSEDNPLEGLALPAEPLNAQGEDFLRQLAQNPPVPTALAAPAKFPSVPGYEILEELGRGGMGVVYKARQLTLMRSVALKMILSGSHAGPEQMARFHSEAMAMARLQHPNIVQIFEVGEVEKLPFLAMEFVDGGNLAQRLRKESFTAAAAAHLVKTLATTVHFAHERGILHRDLKPANILLADLEVPKITDFGLAKQIAGPDTTHSSAIMGTPQYLAPEQTGVKEATVGPATDVYALGVILYELLTGQPPFRGPYPLEILLRVREEEPDSPRLLQSKTPVGLEAICLKCLQKRPARRYATAAALAEDLGRFLAGEPVLARPPGMAEQGLRWARRHKGWTFLILIVFLFFGIIVAGLFIYNRDLAAINANLNAANQALQTSAKELDKQREEAQTSRLRAERERDASYTALQRGGIEAARRLLHQHHYAEVSECLERVPISRRAWEWHRLVFEEKLALPPVTAIGVHDFGVLDFVVSGDGSVVISSGQDGRVIAWDGAGKAFKELERGVWSEKGRYWSNALLASAEKPTSMPRQCFGKLCWMRPGVLLAGTSLNGEAVFWDLEHGTREKIFTHNRPLLAAATLPEEGLFLVGDDQGTLFFQSEKQKEWQSRNIGGGPIHDVLLLSASRCVVGQESRIAVVSLGDGRLLQDIKCRGPVWNLALSPDGKRLATACSSRFLHVYAVRPEDSSFQLQESLPLPATEDLTPDATHAVCFSPDGRWLLVEDDLGRLMAWKTGASSPFWVYEDQRGSKLSSAAMAKLAAPLRRRCAAIRFGAEGGSFFTAGQDTVIKRWELSEQKGITLLRVGPRPVIEFDPSAPALLWVGNAAGGIALWDTVSRQKLDEIAGHSAPLVALSVAGKAQVVATVGEDRTIRLWQRQGNRIVALKPLIEHDGAMRSVVLSPDGTRIAAYDQEDYVLLWETSSGRRISRLKLPREAPSRGGGALAFNADGGLLAVAGPGQSLWLLKGDQLSPHEKVESGIVSGEGGTALAWHPNDTRQLWVGDTLGRLACWPKRSLPWSHAYLHTPIVGLAFCPDGRRFASSTAAGNVQIVDPEWVGLSHTLQSPFADRNKLGGGRVHFDASGRRLAMAQQDGQVAIWETAPIRVSLPEKGERNWRETIWLEDEKADGIVVRPEGVCLDERGRLCMLYSRLAKNTVRSGGPSQRWVCLGRETEAGWSEVKIGGPRPEEERVRQSHGRSLALLRQEKDLWAVFRQPEDKPNSSQGQLLLFRVNGNDVLPMSGEELFAPANWGFEAHPLPGKGSRPSVLHYGHDSSMLRVTRWQAGEWRTEPVGKFGDGLWHDVTADAEGRWHLLFRPFRFGSDRHPLMYLRLVGNNLAEEVREVADPALKTTHRPMVMGQDGALWSVFRRPGKYGATEIVLAHRSKDGWKHSVLLSGVDISLSNMAIDGKGMFYFAYFDSTSRRLMLATGSANSWTSEPVWLDPEPHDELTRLPQHLIVLMDVRATPVIVALTESASGKKSVRMFRSSQQLEPARGY